MQKTNAAGNVEEGQSDGPLVRLFAKSGKIPFSILEKSFDSQSLTFTFFPNKLKFWG